MAIYISKEAIKHNPFVEEEINKEERKYPPLTTDLLKTKYLEAMMRRPKAVKYLKITNTENDYLSVVRIKAALNIIHAYFNSYKGKNYQISGNIFRTEGTGNGSFDQKLHNAIFDFQNFVDIKANGVVGPKTLYFLDNFIHNIYFDPQKNKVIGKAFNKNVTVKKDIDATGKYTYTVRSGEKWYTFTTNELLQVTPIESIESEALSIVSTPDIIDSVIEQNSLLKEEENSLRESKTLILDQFYTQQLNTPIKTFNDLQPELDIKPPTSLPKDQAKLYLVKEGDTPLKILEETYYNNKEVHIKNPSSNIYTFKAQELNTNVATREHDAKLHFYLNLIYYYNIVEEKDGSVLEYGIEKTGGYQRYEDDHLNEFEMFANVFNETQRETALPNYYHFLKYQESKGSKITFDATGETTSFKMHSGKYIYIPSREFADSLYYHLNFRHKEMLVENEDGYSYLEDNAFIKTASDITLVLAKWVHETDELVNELLDFFISETEKLLKETIAFFKQGYAYLKEFAKEFPRGFGAEVEAGLGVTWAVPIATDIVFKRTFYRKMTPLTDFTIVLREFKEAFVGADIGVGATFGFKVGSGKNQKAVGLQTAFGVKGGLAPNITMEYEFPVRQEETATIAMLISVFGDETTKTAGRLLGNINGFNIDPKQYLTYMKTGFPFKTDVWGNAQIGIVDGKANEDKNIIIPATKATEKKNKGFLGISSVWDIISGAGVSVTGGIAIGPEFEYKAKYGKKPCMPEISGRMPSEVEVKNSFVASGNLATGGMGTLLQKFLMAKTVEPFLNILNFDSGFGVGLERKWTRHVDARNISLADVNVSGEGVLDNATIGETNGKAVFGNNKGTWETQFTVERFSGDVDALFVSGAETGLKFDTGKLVNIIRKNDDFFSLKNLQDILGILYSIELQYKPGFGYNARKSKQLFSNSVLENMAKGVRTGSKRDFITAISNDKNKKYKTGLDVYAGIHIKLEFKVQNLTNLIFYYLQRWYYMLKKTASGILKDLDNWNDAKKAIEEVIKDFNKSTVEKQTSKEYYEGLFAQLNTFIEGVVEEDGKPENFIDAAKELFNITSYLIQYVNVTDIILNPIKAGKDGLSKNWEDMDIQRFTQALVAMADIVEAKVSFEAKFGALVSAGVSVADGAKIRLSVLGGGAVVYHPIIMEGNKIIPLTANDLEKALFTQLETLIDIDGVNAKPNGIRQAIISLPN